MRVAPSVNADPNAVVVVDTNKMAWEDTGHAGVGRKVLEFFNDPKKGRETCLLQFKPGAKLPPETLQERLDIYVLEGSFSDGDTEYGPETFLRIPSGARFSAGSKSGATLYVKRRVPIRPGQPGERITIDTRKADWLDFPHRGSRVLHLYRNTDGIETSRIGNVYPERKLPSHDHAIGEETLVLEGCLSDEYAAYTAGVWFRMPCGKPHAPFTQSQNAKMLIREGDLVW